MPAPVGVRGDRELVALARVLIVFAVAVWMVLSVLVVFDPPAASTSPDRYETIWLTLAGLVVAVVGCLLAARLPRHAVPWLLAVPALITVVVLGPGYYAFDPPSTPAEATMVALLNALFFVSLIGLILFFPLFFPDGRLLGRRWRGVLLGGCVVLGATALWALYDENDFEGSPALGIGTRPGGDALWNVFGPAVLAAGLAVFVLGVISLGVKYRRGSPVLRRQMRVPFVVMGLWVGIAVLVGSILGDTAAGDAWGSAASIFLPAAFVAAIVVSVTRLGLYELDRLVNRTIVYTIVVALLGALFAAGALWLPSRLPGNDSSIAVAASTLAVAALFNPLRRRVQRFVDRRFYRAKYDAQHVVDEFAAGLRDELDAEVVAANWVDVVTTTLQPSAISVWVGEWT
jgi:hypothetical protein